MYIYRTFRNRVTYVNSTEIVCDQSRAFTIAGDKDPHDANGLEACLEVIVSFIMTHHEESPTTFALEQLARHHIPLRRKRFGPHDHVSSLAAFTTLVLAQATFAAAFSAGIHAGYQPGRQYPPEEELAAAAPSSMPLTYYENGYYLLNVSIGTPVQTFRLLFDTASANLWVVNKACRTPDCTGDLHANFTKSQFDGGRSSTFNDLNEPISVAYYDLGVVKGIIGKDKINFQGVAEASAKFAVISKPPGGLADCPMDGIIGMAFPPLADQRTDPPLSQVTFGDLDNMHCSRNEYLYTDLSAQKFWQIPVDKFAISSYTFGQTQQAFLDTGSDWLAFPPAQILAIISATNAEYRAFKGYYTVDCNANLPEIRLSISGTVYTISKDQYTARTGSECWLRLNFYDVATADPNAPTTVLGQPFIEKRCVAFDVAKKRVGIASAYP